LEPKILTSERATVLIPINKTTRSKLFQRESRKPEPEALVFDAYGTLFDLSSVVEHCEKIFPEQGAKISQLWRQKQLEYTWLRSLMNNYANFETVTRESLRFTLSYLELAFTEDIIETLFQAYLNLKPFPEIAGSLRIAAPRARLAVLSNGTDYMLKEIISRSGLASMFVEVMSVDQIKTYKPDPKVYALAQTKLNIHPKDKILFVSSNTWDVAGAKSFGLLTAWINRGSSMPFIEFGLRSDFRVSNLGELVARVFEL